MAEKTEQRVVGDVVMRRLDSVQKNDWNPNVMTDFMKESLKHGLQHDGWLKSQSILVWGKDDQGAQRDVIIDGEHRWTAATELGFVEGPMVVLDGLTESQAKALTVKMNQKRGEFDPTDLGALLRSIQYDLGVDSLSMDLGLPDDTLLSMLAEPEIEADVSPELPEPEEAADPNAPEPAPSQVRMQNLFFNVQQHEEFTKIVKELAPKYGTKNVTDTVLEALRRANSAAPEAAS